jgi:hypothetical protein
MEYKVCRKCLQEKPLDEFYVWKDKKIQAYCKPCHKTYRAEHYKQNAARYRQNAKRRREQYYVEIYTFLKDYTKDGCVQCGEKDFVCMEFDHIDPSTKDATIGEMIQNQVRRTTLLKELEKCQILCCNCHRKRTADQFGWYSVLAENLGV